MDTLTYLLLAIAFLVVPVLISITVDGLRPLPITPESLYWNGNIPIQYVTVNGMKLRFIKAGKGPNLVLLHTLRSQLDIFEKVIPQLTDHYTVYALDFPGHGFSDIPKTEYVPDVFVAAVEGFLDALNIESTSLAGVSIGGTIPLLIAARHNKRVRNVISINPYDYGNGRGVERGNLVARLVFTLARVPVVGETVMRLRQPFVEKVILQGGVTRADALTPGFLQEMWASGVRKGHYRAFINLIRNSAKWEQARTAYKNINVPVVLVYGDKDWSSEAERKRTLNEVPGATLVTIEDGGHFLSLDQPEKLAQVIRQHANT
jgi:pimeloyl-ACP methyl ester carboxylesterase